MRIDDNLGQNISSFYAEILKIKNIVKASKEGKKVLFLLDEIFKGTNSKDRHTGAMILVRQLSRTGNLGFISTHDLELGEMANHKDSKVKNYHFSEYYRDSMIYFDYKLKVGISTTRNAMYLMKLALKFKEIDDKYGFQPQLCVYNCAEYGNLSEQIKVNQQLSDPYAGFVNLNGTKIGEGIQSSIPSIEFLAKEYGDAKSDILFDYKSVICKWTDMHFDRNPNLDKSILFLDLNTSVMWR